MNLRSILSVSLFSVILLAGCKKDDDDDNNNSQPQGEKNLTASKWKVDAATANGTNIGTFVACYLDNILTFTADKKGTIDEGGNVCSPTTAGNFTWSLNESQTELTMSAKLLPAGSDKFTVVSLTATNLVLSQATALPPLPGQTVVTVSFSHP